MSCKQSLSSLLVAVLATTVFALDRQDPSFDPPGGLAVEDVPQFVVLGFDDNRYVDGMEWTLQMLADKKNPAGSGNPATYDGQPVSASFYHTSGALDEGGTALVDSWKKAVERGYEVGDHTVTHETGQSTSLEAWRSEIAGCRAKLVEKLGISADEVYGFRTPYLAFNDATFSAIAAEGLLYECTMTQMQDFNKSLFVWPYTLDNGFADKVIEGWVGKCKIPGLWEIPVYTVSPDATLLWPPITGFDSSILTQASGGQFEAMLKNALDYRLKQGGNRAPMTVGLHTDTYAEANPSGVNYDPALNLAGRRAALEGFIDYALSKPMVRLVSAKQLIDWMRNPVALGDVTATLAGRTVERAGAAPFTLAQGRITLNQALSADATLSVYAVSGRLLHRAALGRAPAGTSLSLPRLTGACIVTLSAAGMSHSQRMVTGRGLHVAAK